MPQHDATTSATADPTASAETKVLTALRAHPGSTVTEIATHASVGRSTAGKILAVAERRGRARRTPGTTGPSGRTPDRWNASVTVKPERLGRGELRALVVDYLARHPGSEFTPTALGKALDRSSGAIANALTTLTATGQVIQTNERPVRYGAPRAKERTTEPETWRQPGIRSDQDPEKT